MKSSIRSFGLKLSLAAFALALAGPPAVLGEEKSPSPDQKPVSVFDLSFERFTSYFSGDLPARPGVILRFNQAVTPEAVQQRVFFSHDESDSRVAARVRAVTSEEALPLQPSGSAGADAVFTLPLENFVHVEPLGDLKTDQTWYLQVEKDLASADGTHAVKSGQSNYLGKRRSFKVTSVNFHQPYDAPRSVSVSFNKRLHERITAAELENYLSLSPAPADYKVRIGDYGLLITGSFRHGANYRLSLKSGLIAEDESFLENGVVKSHQFTPNPGFISLPAFSTAQPSSGEGQFEVRSGNLENIRIRVKELERNDLIYALRGYQVYRGNGNSRQHIPFETVPGRVIFDRTFKNSEELDRTLTTTLEWKDILKNGSHTALYLCAEGNSKTQSRLDVGAQAVVQLTDIGLAWKHGRDDTLVYAFSNRNGRPLPNVLLELVSENNDSLAQLRTNDDGIARLPKNADLDKSHWLLASRGQDRFALAFNGRASNVDNWRFRVPYRYDYEDEDVFAERRMILFTDRSAYRPGETLYLKGVTRATDGDQLLPPGGDAGKTARLKIFDAQYREIVTKEVTFSDYGSFDEEIDLPESPLGWYRVQVDFNEDETDRNRDYRQIFHHSFQVADYRPNTFEIDIDTETPKPADGQLNVPVTATYFIGKPLSKAQLNWHARVSTAVPSAAQFPDFVFSDQIENRHFSETLSGTEVLDASGGTVAALRLPTPNGPPSPLVIELNAEITDINQQTVSASGELRVDSSEFYLGARSGDQLYTTERPVTLDLLAIDSGGAALDRDISARLKVEKEEWNTVKIRGTGGAITHRNEVRLKSVHEKDITIKAPAAKKTETSFDEPWSFATTAFPLAEAGNYRVTLTATDSADQEVRTALRFAVHEASDATDLTWQQSDGATLDLTADKERYTAGDTARIQVKSPIEGHALVTLERTGVRESFTTRITGKSTLLEVPITAGSSPNVFVSVMLVRGLQQSPHQHPSTDYRIGYCNLQVDDPQRTYDVELTTTKDAYEPKDAVEITALVKDGRGKPVSGAELTLYAVDEGILNLTGYENPDPHAVFGADFPLAVRSGQTVSEMLPEAPEHRYFGNKGYVIGGGDEGGGDLPLEMRKDFKALAYWNARLVTNPEGKVTASFTAPDSLTEYRLIAVANSTHNGFGNGISKFTVTKPVVLQAAMPAFANVADRVEMKAVIHNNTPNPVNLEVSLELDRTAFHAPDGVNIIPAIDGAGQDPDAATSATRPLLLQAGETGAVRFPVAFREAGKAKWKWTAKSKEAGGPGDATETTLEVGYPVPLLRNTRSFRLTEAGTSENLLASVDQALLNGKGTVKVSLSNSRMVEAVDALEYLLHYPYGCVEQTTSSTLPWLSTQAVKDALPQLKKSDAEIRKAIEYGTQRLLTMQTHEGGLSYWPGATEPVLWGSSYGGMALALAQRQGFDLPKDRTDALWKYLSDSLRNSSDMKDPYELSQRCLALYTLALAGKPETGYYDVLYKKREQLPQEARALLALAMLESTPDVAAIRPRVTDLLAAAEDVPKNKVTWYGAGYTYATQILAWTKFAPGDERLEALVDELMKHSRGEFAWGNTYNNAWPLLALARHTEANQKLLANVQCKVAFGGETRNVQFEERIMGAGVQLDFSGDRSSVPLTVEMSQAAPMYVHLELETRPNELTAEAKHEGFGITRSYHRLDNDGTLHEPDQLTVGDLVLVTLQVTVGDERESYLAIDDPLPATFEAINPNFESQAAVAKKGPRGAWKRLPYHHQELRKDRALFFCNYLWGAGEYSVQYLARVVAAGEVTAPAAKIEAMYEPDRRGLSPTSRLTTTPLKTPATKIAHH